MRRVSRLAFWGIFVLALGVVTSPAQLLNELIRGAVNNVSTDIFGCAGGGVPCGLSYRVYSSVDPSEINGPANPVDGIPAYRAFPQRYLSDVQTTANFPVAAGGGGGNEWYMVWDGITGGGTTDFVGWYGAQSQVVTFGEIGNALSFNCLPVTAQEACFRALDPQNAFNDTTRPDATPLNHEGGISPIPCPALTNNGLTAIDYSWEQAGNSTKNDLAGDALTGYDLYLLGNEQGTDGSFAGSSVLVASINNLSTTNVSVDRSTIVGLESSTIRQAALKMRYAGGLDSTYFSCGSALTGNLCAIEPGDANAVVDVASSTNEVRVEDLGGGDSRDLLMFHIQMDSETIIRKDTKYRLNFFDPVSGVKKVEIKAEFKKKDIKRHGNTIDALRLRISGDDDSDVDDFLRGQIGVVIDDVNGLLTFVIDPHTLACAIQPNQGPFDVFADITGSAQLKGGFQDDFGCGGPTFIGVNGGCGFDDDSDSSSSGSSH